MLLIVLHTYFSAPVLLTTVFKAFPKSVALRLRRICDSDDKFEERNVQNQKYLVARYYKPSRVIKQFSDVRKISREEARIPKNNTNFSASCNLITQYNPLLPNIKTII